MLWSLVSAVTTASTPNIIIIVLLSCATIGITLWYRWLQQNDALSVSKFAQRGIKFVKQPNLLLLILRKVRIEQMLQKLIQREGKIFGMNMLGSPTIVLTNPELIGVVLSKEFTNFTNRRSLLIDGSSGDSLFSNMISAAEDDRWKRLRSIVTPTFSTAKLRQMKPCLDDTVHQLMHDLDDQLVNNSDDESGLAEVNIKPLCGAFTMNTIIQVAFGVKVNAMAAPDNPIIKHARKLFNKDMSLKDIAKFTIVFVMPRVAKFFGISLFKNNVTEFLTEFSQKIITEKRTAMLAKRGQQDQYKASNFIEFLLEAKIDNDDNDDNVEKLNGKKHNIDSIDMSTIEHSNVANGSSVPTISSSSKYITNQEIISQCVQFLLAGYDTTATTITMAIYLLALNPDKQEKLHQEIVRVIQQLTDESNNNSQDLIDVDDDPVRLITIDTLTRFEYLNGVINETLRLYAPTNATERRAAKDIELQSTDGQYRVAVKKGDIIHIPIYTIHRDVEHYPNPDQFEPERFINGTAGGNTHHKYAYLPFGGGPRNCVARSLALIEVKLAVLHLIRKFRFTSNARTSIPVQLYNQSGLISPKDIILSVKKR